MPDDYGCVVDDCDQVAVGVLQRWDCDPDPYCESHWPRATNAEGPLHQERGR